MTRTVLPIAAALLALPMLLTSAAEACISCEYVPEVVRESEMSDESEASNDPDSETSEELAYVRAHLPVFVRERVYSEEGEYPTHKPIVKSESGDTPDIRVPINTRPKDENSSISVAREAAAVNPKAAQSENSSIAHEPTSCKKFFSAVGMTLAVPCE